MTSQVVHISINNYHLLDVYVQLGLKGLRSFGRGFTSLTVVRLHNRWPNARKMLRPTMLRYEAIAKRSQHIPTMLGATCCTRLATLLQHVGCCWLKFENGQIFYATFVDVACYCRRLALGLGNNVAPSHAH